MTRSLLFAIAFIGLCFTTRASAPFPRNKKIPVWFVENRGQVKNMAGKVANEVLFTINTPGLDVYLTTRGLTYVFYTKDSSLGKNGLRWEKMEMQLEGANILKEKAVGEKSAPGEKNYFYPHCPDGIRHVKQFEQVLVSDVYPGIDWLLYNSGEKGLKYDFILKPGADPKQISLLYRSIPLLEKNKSGDLKIESVFASLTEKAPVSYLQNSRMAVASSFILSPAQKKEQCSETRVRFLLGTKTNPYRHSQALVIDPQLIWGTFFGGSSDDVFTSAVTDNANNLFITGSTQSVDFPVQDAGSFFQGTIGGTGGATDVQIVKFDNLGTLVWSTYYGGGGMDMATTIDVNAAGDIFVGGNTASQDFPLQNNGNFFQGSNVFMDGFILKFDNQGARQWATYYGGQDGATESINGLVIDNNGNLWVTGVTRSGNFPLQSAGASFFQGSTVANFESAFVLKFTTFGQRIWATYFGSVGVAGNSIATDGSNVFITGSAASTCTLPLVNAGGSTYYQAQGAGGQEAFICKFLSNNQLAWSTFYGSTGSEYGNTVVCDAAGNVFVSGITNSPNFPLQNAGTYYQASGLGNDLFILKFDNTGTRLWGTCYGGTGLESMGTTDNLAVDGCGNLYAGFITQSNNIQFQVPCDGGFFDNVRAGSSPDLCLARFTNNGALTWSTFLGGDGTEQFGPLAVNTNDHLFVAAGAFNAPTPSSYPLTDPGGGAYFNPFNSGLADGFIARFVASPTLAGQSFSYTSSVCTSAGTVSPQLSPNFVTGGTFLSTPGLSVNPATGNIFAASSSPGTYLVTYSLPVCGCITSPPIAATVQIVPSASISVNSATTCQGVGATLVATAVPSASLTYTWTHNGVIADSVEVYPTANTVYTVRADNGVCISSATAMVMVSNIVIPSVNFFYASPVCTNGGTLSVLYNGTFNYGGIFTSSGDDFSLGTLTVDSLTGIVNLNGSQPGTYLISYNLAAKGCTASGTQSTMIVVKPSPNIQLAQKVSVIEGNSVTLDVSGGSDYTWEPPIGLSCIKCEDPSASPVDDTKYCVGAIVDGCYASACIEVDVICYNQGDLTVPNAFTPNGDQNNDRFCLQGWSRCSTSFNIKIFDRWGAVVFESANPSFCWDGKFNGQELNTEVFVYYITASFNNEPPITKSGNITLIR